MGIPRALLKPSQSPVRKLGLLGADGWRPQSSRRAALEPRNTGQLKGNALCGQLSPRAGDGLPAFLPRQRARRLFPSAAEDAINSVIFLVFCLFPWNGLMDVNNYQTIKASKCAIFYRSKSSNK